MKRMFVLAVLYLLLSVCWTATFNVAFAAPIPSTQDPNAGPAFIGTAAIPKPLPEQPTHEPVTVGLHADGGNTKVYKTPGPLGVDPEVTSVLGTGSIFMFDETGRMNGSCMSINQDQPTIRRACIAAFDPSSLDILARWDAPDGQNLNLAYMIQTIEGRILVTSKEGHIYVLERSDDTGTPEFHISADIDLVALGVLDGSLPLLAASFDNKSNIWFTTGGIVGIGDQPGSDTVLGYVDKKGIPYWITLKDQIVENGIAVNDNGVFVLTGPAGDADVPGASGYVYSFRAKKGVKILWMEKYDAGSGLKPGGFARGSGSTPTLIGYSYLAMTDNADDQVSVHFFHQAPEGPNQHVCSIPVFDHGASANDIGMIGVRHEDMDSVVVLNDYNAPSVYIPLDNGPLQSMNGMAPGVQRIDIDSGGNCATRWTLPIRIKSVPVVSTETGLIYGYTQDEALAAEGTYTWYFVAIDYDTGEVVWKIRAGAGFTFNDSFRGAVLAPDGTLYQTTIFGNVILRDGE